MRLAHLDEPESVPSLELEDLGSKGALRILRVLAEYGELNITELGRKTQLNHTSVSHHVEKLLRLNLLVEKRYGKIRILVIAFDKFTIQFKKGVGVSLVRI